MVEYPSANSKILRIRYYLGGALFHYYRAWKSSIYSYRNPFLTTLKIIFFSKGSNFILRDGSIIKAKNRFDIYNHGINFNANHRKFSDREIENLLHFGKVKISVQNKIVVVVGAYRGEETIMYALAGAKEVYAYEPFPMGAKECIRNIKRFNVENVVKIYNSAVGISGTINVSADKLNSPGDEIFLSDPHGMQIQVKTLDDIMSNIDSKDCVLSMNCEGCEYVTLKEASNKTLAKFSAIHIEYHYGVGDLPVILHNNGFSVQFSKPVFRKNMYVKSKSHMLMGSLYAIKK